VTALEPVLKACGGTWIAHGSGDADREVVDHQSKIRVPPEEPQYVLKRVWLTKEEEKGYYYGFSNEGSGRSATLRTHGLLSTGGLGILSNRQ